MLTPEDVTDALTAVADTVAKVDDPVLQAQLSTAALKTVVDVNARLRDMRRDAVLTLVFDRGMRQTDVARLLGVSVGRITQIVKDWRADPRPGKIEVDARLDAAAMKSDGATDEQIAAALIPKILDQRSPAVFPAARLAQILDVKPSIVTSVIRDMKG